MGIAARTAEVEDWGAVAAFLRDAEYAGDVLPSDRLVTARQDGCLVGAFRLVREHDVLVLRGMRVRSDLRRRGIGAQLLETLHVLGEPCFCVPHAHLEGFYGNAGFVRLQEAAAPDFLSTRAAAYRARGLDVIVMKRELEPRR